MKHKTKIFIIVIMAWIGITFVLVVGYSGFDFIGIASNSMKHENETLFVQFWNKKGCNLTCLDEFPIRNGFQGGDMVVVQKTSDYGVGDVVAYHSGCLCEGGGIETCRCAGIIVHRMTGTRENFTLLTGDNIGYFIENKIPEEAIERKFIIGKVIFNIPKLGIGRALLNCLVKGKNPIDCIVNGNCG